MKLFPYLLLGPLSAWLSACTAPARAPRPIQVGPPPFPRVAAERPPSVDHHARAERDAAEVFRAMHADLLACFTRAPVLLPDATAHVVVDVLVGPDGSVRDVTTAPGARASVAATRCIERRIARATFAPPRGGGTSRVRVPFAFSFEP